MTTPAPGRIVLFPLHSDQDLSASNGAEVVPAIITRVWSDTMVNVMVFLDGPTLTWRTSVPLYAGPEQYAEAKAIGRPMGCYWPPRV